ncbi:MAG: hypothetical protein P8Y27_17615 [Chromatiaceae bacterium]
MQPIAQAAETLKRQWSEFYNNVAKPPRCIYCGGSHISWNGSRCRCASALVDGQVVFVDEFRCRLVECGDCGKSWTLRPPGLAPHRHFQLDVVAGAVGTYLFDPEATQKQVAASVGCDRRTVGRWLGWLAAVADPGDLARHLADASGVPELPRVPEVAALGRKASTAARQSLLKIAALILCLLEALAHALCFPPPGLQSVVGAVLAEGARATTYRAPRIHEFARRHLDLPGGTLPM